MRQPPSRGGPALFGSVPTRNDFSAPSFSGVGFQMPARLYRGAWTAPFIRAASGPWGAIAPGFSQGGQARVKASGTHVAII